MNENDGYPQTPRAPARPEKMQYPETDIDFILRGGIPMNRRTPARALADWAHADRFIEVGSE